MQIPHESINDYMKEGKLYCSECLIENTKTYDEIDWLVIKNNHNKYIFKNNIYLIW